MRELGEGDVFAANILALLAGSKRRQASPDFSNVGMGLPAEARGFQAKGVKKKKEKKEKKEKKKKKPAVGAAKVRFRVVTQLNRSLLLAPRSLRCFSVRYVHSRLLFVAFFSHDDDVQRSKQ